MTIPQLKSVTFGITVEDLDAATAWYTRLLGVEPEIEPDQGIIEFCLLPGVWLQLSEGAASTIQGGASINLQVADIEAGREALKRMGIKAGPVERIEDVVALCDFSDLDGRPLSLVQVLGA
jgi:catechol 2,3-dioxygenase-like lactoylglutathione lyase family enzyme